MAAVETLSVFGRNTFFETIEREQFRRWVWDQLVKEQLEKAEAVQLDYMLYRRRRALHSAHGGMAVREADERTAILEKAQAVGAAERGRNMRGKLHKEAAKLIGLLAGRKKEELGKYKSD